jgi:hypothetical protein
MVDLLTAAMCRREARLKSPVEGARGRQRRTARTLTRYRQAVFGLAHVTALRPPCAAKGFGLSPVTYLVPRRGDAGPSWCPG